MVSQLFARVGRGKRQGKRQGQQKERINYAQFANGNLWRIAQENSLRLQA